MADPHPDHRPQVEVPGVDPALAARLAADPLADLLGIPPAEGGAGALRAGPTAAHPHAHPARAGRAARPPAALLASAREGVRPGYPRAGMAVGPRHVNAVGTAHGGATMALLDVVHAAVSNSHGAGAGAQGVHT